MKAAVLKDGHAQLWQRFLNVRPTEDSQQTPGKRGPTMSTCTPTSLWPVCADAWLKAWLSRYLKLVARNRWGIQVLKHVTYEDMLATSPSTKLPWVVGIGLFTNLQAYGRVAQGPASVVTLGLLPNRGPPDLCPKPQHPRRSVLTGLLIPRPN